MCFLYRCPSEPWGPRTGDPPSVAHSSARATKKNTQAKGSKCCHKPEQCEGTGSCLRSGDQGPCGISVRGYSGPEALGAQHKPSHLGGCPAPDSALARPRAPPCLAGAADTPGCPQSWGRGHGNGAGSAARERRAEALLGELEARVQDVVRASSWWERHGVDGAVLGLSLLSLPPGFLCLRSDNVLVFVLGISILGVCHYTLTVKGSHLATHGALTESKCWSKIWAHFFVEVCTAFPAEDAKHGHVKMHHGYTNVLGLGDSSTWKVPCLNRYVYMFLAPLLIPVLTPLVAVERLRKVKPRVALRTLGLISLGLYSHYWLLLNVSGFQSPGSALVCMLSSRSLLAHPYLHVNIFQHIGLPMFSRDKKPRRIHMMSLGVLNLPRLPLLDWAFGHSIVSCHVEHHLFPQLSDHMCLKVKPVVSQFLREKQLPYNEDTYLARFRLFLSHYDELMVQTPPITELVGLQ